MSQDSRKGAALQSLTATYTDSEDSADESDNSETQGPRLDTIDEKSTSRDSTPYTFAVSSLERRTGTGLVNYSTYEGMEGREENMDDIDYGSDSSDVEASQEAAVMTPERRKAEIENRRPITPITFHRSLLARNPVVIELPSEHSGICSKALQDKISRLYEKKVREGKNMNNSIQSMKDFRNPSIYEKLITYCGIDEKGTNYPPEIFDPSSWGKESFYEELGKRQKEEMDKKEKERKDRTKVEFISGTAKRPVMDASSMDLALRRKSKWDQGAAMQVPLKPASLITAASVIPVTAASGTKPTVISAFGTISKKKP